ncbi:putative reverse transcriptase domain-containing protein [Tanacetum coccineum]
MDWLSKRKFVIVCYEKVVRIPLEGDEILRVHEERTLGAAKALMNARVDEPRISDIPMARDITDAFQKTCWGYHRDDKLSSAQIWFMERRQSRTDGQSEHMIQTLEDIMRACVIDFGGSYQMSIRCAPFEALYGRKCRSPVLWAKIGESSLIGPELVQETTDKVVMIKEKLKAARDHQKSYADNRRKLLEFEVGDRALLKVSPWKGVIRFGKKGQLAPRYVGPFEILKRISRVAYRLRLPEELSGVNKILRFVEEHVEIMDHEIRSLKRSRISLVKVHWNSKRGPEFTWEREDHMRSKYPPLFVDRAEESAS